MKRSVLSNISFNFMIKVITYVFSFLMVMYVARVLQPEAYGRISFASSFTGYFVMFANLGLPIYAMRSCAEHRDDRKELSSVFQELWSINVILSVISSVLLLGIVALVPKLRENGNLLMVFGSAIFFQMIGCEWLFKGLEKFRFLAVSAFCCKLISLILILLFVHSDEHTILYAVLSVLTGYGSNVVSFLVLRKYVDLRFVLRINKAHFKPLFVFFLMSCAVSIYSSLDLTMLGFMRSDYETGLYQLASKGKSVLTLLGGIVWSSILPLASRLWREGERKQFESLAAKSMTIVCGIQLLVMTGALIFSREIMLFIGGEEYLESVDSFRILLLSLVPIGASNILGGQVLIPAGMEKKLLRAELLGAGFNFIANLIAIPYFSILGAAVTTTVSEVIVWLVCLYYVKKDLDMDFGVGLLRRLGRKCSRKARVLSIRTTSRLRGEKQPFYCPCCDTYLKRFVNVGFDKRPERYNPDRYRGIDQDVICPMCGSLPRHRILVSWMNDHVEIIREKRILHFAQERSIRMWMDRNGIKSITADLYSPADLKLNIEDTGLEDDSYDLIICNHVLEHVSDYKKALRELHRIIRPAGKVIISFPVDQTFSSVYEDPGITTEKDRILNFGQNDHLRVFGMDSPEMLEGFGFKVTSIKGENCDEKIKPVVGPADYDYNVLWVLEKDSAKRSS